MKLCTNCNKEITSGRVICKECYTQLDEWKDKAKKYDEKETPKKPIRKRIYYNCHNGECDKTFFYYCPVCNFHSIDKDYANFCPNCGQKIDWSDEYDS